VTGKLAFVCGLESEARILRQAGPSMRAAIGISGAGPDRAAREAERLVQVGANRLISFGVAGGLTPGLVPGTVLCASEILTEQGERFAAHPIAGLPAHPILGVDRVIISASQKADLYARTGAAALDMESHAVARVARDTGVAFGAIRAIADPYDRVLPPLALDAVDEKGRTRLGATLWGLLKNPAQLPALMALGRDSARAHQGLRRAVDFDHLFFD